MNLPFRDRDPASSASADLERRLRAGADAFAPAPSPELRTRILAALRATPQHAQPPAPAALRADPRGSWLAAAAALFVLASAWWLTRRDAPGPARERTVVALSRGILDAGSRVFALPSRAEDSLRVEAERLLADTTRAAEGLVRGLPAPLRSKLEQL